MQHEFGPALKEWREKRHLSQLALGLEADVSARHISFMETGRARPSRGMVLRLCERLEVPRETRNRMLTAAGLAPAYDRRDSSAQDLAPIRTAIDRMLERHAPYPAFSIDRHWQLVDLNPPAAMLFASVGLQPGASLIDALLDNAALRAAIGNLDEVMRHSATRLRTESAHLGGDPVLDHAVVRMEANLAPSDEAGFYPAVIPTIYRVGPQTLSLFGTVAQFGTTEDVALSELRIELLFPADEPTRRFFEAQPE